MLGVIATVEGRVTRLHSASPLEPEELGANIDPATHSHLTLGKC